LTQSSAKLLTTAKAISSKFISKAAAVPRLPRHGRHGKATFEFPPREKLVAPRNGRDRTLRKGQPRNHRKGPNDVDAREINRLFRDKTRVLVLLSHHN